MGLSSFPISPACSVGSHYIINSGKKGLRGYPGNAIGVDSRGKVGESCHSSKKRKVHLPSRTRLVENRKELARSQEPANAGEESVTFAAATRSTVVSILSASLPSESIVSFTL